jgi:dUTP pyrophosphatase
MNFIDRHLKIHKLYSDVPEIKFGTEYSACFDISAYLPYHSSLKAFTKSNDEVTMLTAQESDGRPFIELPPEWRALIPTGMILDIPENHCVKVYARSGLSTKKGLNLINSVGIIDADYVEQLLVPVYNNSQQRLKIYNGDRIAQGELAAAERMLFSYINERPQKKTDREGGFGSTGVNNEHK